MTRRRVHVAAGVLGVLGVLALSASCGGDSVTEVVLVVDSDLGVPDELDQIQITVAGRAGAPTMLSADLTEPSTPDLPLTLTLFPESEPPSDFTVTIVGSLGGSSVARWEADTGFVPGESRMLRALLAARCQTVSCDAGRVCDETGCRSRTIAASALPEWPGQAPVLDGPACSPRDEICNGIDDDCDDETDEGIDVMVDPMNCGECGRACPTGSACNGGFCDDELATGVAAGGAHSCAILADTQLACWGWNLYGQLGDGTTVDRGAPVTVVGLMGVTQVSPGVAHTCAVDATQTAFCWGDNSNGELGDGTTEASPVPVPSMLASVGQVSAGVAHTCAITSAGDVACWGRNDSGQLGAGDTMSRAMPTPVVIGNSAVSVAAGFRHTCAAFEGGSVSCWGAGGRGQLGSGTEDQLLPTPVPGIASASAVAAGRFHTCALLADGTVSCWGDASRGQLGDGTTTSRSMPGPAMVPAGALQLASSAAAEHTCVVESAQTSCWGANGSMQTSLDESMAILPRPVMASFADPTMVAVGGAGSGGRGHTCALTAAGFVQCVGDNALGQLGDGSFFSSAEPVTVSLRRR